MKVNGYFLNEKLSVIQRRNFLDGINGCLNRICITDDVTELITMEMSINYNVGILIKNRLLELQENVDNEKI